MHDHSSPSTATSLRSLVATVLLTLVLGVGATAIGFQLAVRHDQAQLEIKVQEAVNTFVAFSSQASFMSSMLSTINIAFMDIQNDIAADIPITEKRLFEHLWPDDTAGLEGTSLEFLPRLTPEELHDPAVLAHLLGNSEASNFSIVELDSGKLEASPRTEYFPVIAEANHQAPLDTLGIDRFNLLTDQFAMVQARDSGKLTSSSYFPNSNNPNDFQITHYYYPLYRYGNIPNTIKERRELLVGYASAFSKTPATAVSGVLPEPYNGIEASFAPINTPQLLTEQNPKLVALIKNGVAKLGTYQVSETTFAVLATASEQLAKAQQSLTRWWILGTGLLITIWIISLKLMYQAQTLKMVALVKERTRDLADRTTALTDANIALQESEQRYRLLADNVIDVISTFDLQGTFTYVTPSITQLTGRRSSEYLGRPIWYFLKGEIAEQAKQRIAGMSETLRSRPQAPFETQVLEYDIYHIDGSRKTVETKFSAIRDNTGNAIGLLSTLRDISERKTAEQESEKLQHAYRQSQKMESIGTLAGGIAHDFNNLLTGVLGQAELLKLELSDTSSAQKGLEVIALAATRAQELTRQLLGFARKGKFMQVPVEINTVLTDVVGFIKGTFDKNIVVTQVACDGNPTVLGDPSQISQIFLNLAVNARDAMPLGGTLILKTEICHLDEFSAKANFSINAGTYNVISVCDTGSGIPQELIERIFEPFFTTKEEGKGTGLGLAMVYGVVKNHKGHINVYSEPGKGTVFKIYLPHIETHATERIKQSTKSTISGSGTVFLVDDQEVVRKVGEQMLRKLGYNVVMSDNGKNALDYYQQHSQEIDVIMIDMIMPEMGGIECLEHMKKINPTLKAILATGFSREDIAEKINEAHILGFIQKPFRLQELSEVIAKAQQNL